MTDYAIKQHDNYLPKRLTTGTAVFHYPLSLFRTAWAVLRSLTLWMACCVTAFPFIWMAVSSLKIKEEVMGPGFFPSVPQYGNYVTILFDSPIPRCLFNSLFVAASVAVIQVVSCSLFVYAVTFMGEKAGRGLLKLVLFTYMAPTAATYIPCYMILSRMNLLDSYLGLILSNGVSVFGIFLLSQAFHNIPPDTLEAAKMDGAGNLAILTKIVFPMARPSFATFILLSFINTYNSYMWPSLITDNPSLSLISQGLRRFLYEGGAYGTQWSLVMAAGTAAVVPLLALFALFWRLIVQGITDLGCKG